MFQTAELEPPPFFALTRLFLFRVAEDPIISRLPRRSAIIAVRAHFFMVFFMVCTPSYTWYILTIFRYFVFALLFLFFPPSHLLILSSPCFSSPLPFVTQIRGHIAGTPPPFPLRCVPSSFIARRVQQFLPSSTRVELCVHALLIGAYKPI